MTTWIVAKSRQGKHVPQWQASRRGDDYPLCEWEVYEVASGCAKTAITKAQQLRIQQRCLTDEQTALVMGLLADARRRPDYQCAYPIPAGSAKGMPSKKHTALRRLAMLGLVALDEASGRASLSISAWNLVVSPPAVVLSARPRHEGVTMRPMTLAEKADRAKALAPPSKSKNPPKEKPLFQVVRNSLEVRHEIAAQALAAKQNQFAARHW
ncbi:hypothetical protein VRRI112168_02460 [Vreelandella rituensis]|uniref:Replication protein n=1 Tax=Vreelandella rituensis TaxID=2282306 RepID=A0A368UAI0_9GAMM|nr:hypothetical protein [Halomonas rituensis]RCV93606.1 hypothetical protein DU506_00180 [Halomonas rituensis]